LVFLIQTDNIKYTVNLTYNNKQQNKLH